MGVARGAEAWPREPQLQVEWAGGAEARGRTVGPGPGRARRAGPGCGGEGWGAGRLEPFPAGREEWEDPGGRGTSLRLGRGGTGAEA